MSVPIPPTDPYKEVPPLWRRLLVILLLAVWPAGALFLLLGSAAGEDSFLGRGFTALAGAPWWVAIGAAIADTTGTPLWGCLLFSVGVAIVDAGHTAQERRARRPPQGGNGA